MEIIPHKHVCIHSLNLLVIHLYTQYQRKSIFDTIKNSSALHLLLCQTIDYILIFNVWVDNDFLVDLVFMCLFNTAKRESCFLIYSHHFWVLIYLNLIIKICFFFFFFLLCGFFSCLTLKKRNTYCQCRSKSIAYVCILTKLSSYSHYAWSIKTHLINMS